MLILQIEFDKFDEKPGLAGNREEFIRNTAGWLAPEEASELRENLKIFEGIHEN